MRTILNNVSSKNCVGVVCSSKQDGNFIITKYENTYSVYVKFCDTGYETKAQMVDIRRGNIKDRLNSLLFGVGFIGNKYPTWDNKVMRNTPIYVLWKDMLERCYNTKRHINIPTYINCTVSENFKSYEYFYEWCQQQIGFNQKKWHLDKDLLIKGNKTYSESACVFLPHLINVALTNRKSKRGLYPIGVHKQNKKFIAQLNIKNNKTYLGSFTTPEEAFNAYKNAKESYLKDLANEYKCLLDPRAYQALLNYQVLIND